jgi:hypothetical protein
MFAVDDRAGDVVGLSDEDIVPDTPEIHAAWLIRYAIDSDGLRGRWVLASALRTIHRRAIRVREIEPLPWPTVASLMGQVVPRKHKWVRFGGHWRISCPRASRA